MTEKALFSKIAQIGVVVRDIDKAVEFYQSLGIGPFEPLPDEEIVEREMWGEPVSAERIFKAETRVAKIGSLELELIQPVAGESQFKEFLETKGEGINHLEFQVDDINEGEAELVKKGFSVIYKCRFKNGGGVVFFDAAEIGIFSIELIQQHG